MMILNLLNVKHLHISKSATMEHCDSVIHLRLVEVFYDCVVISLLLEFIFIFSIKTACCFREIVKKIASVL